MSPARGHCKESRASNYKKIKSNFSSIDTGNEVMQTKFIYLVISNFLLSVEICLEIMKITFKIKTISFSQLWVSLSNAKDKQPNTGHSGDNDKSIEEKGEEVSPSNAK